VKAADFDGDGFADVAVSVSMISAPSSLRIHVFRRLGAAGFMSAATTTIVEL
jgi:hypothetical protein